MTSILSEHHGRYSDGGTWRDQTGAADGHRVTLTRAAAGDGLRLSFLHVFPEEPDPPEVALDITLTPRAPSILGFDRGGLTGRGYWDDVTEVLAGTIPIPGNLVEAGHTFSGDTVRGAGTSDRQKRTPPGLPSCGPKPCPVARRVP